MLSICIPVYNCDVTLLVGNLINQLAKNTVSAEIILIDDASDNWFREINKLLPKLNSVRYIQLEKNIGRAKIRNLFLSYSKSDFLLFLDCDSQISVNQFIKNYLTQIAKGHIVICGGRSYNKEVPSKKYYLRWKYGHERECLAAKKRGERPYGSFMSNNFIIHAKILTQIPFDERITQYGHEDTLFGYRLKQNKIPLVHINNTVQHLYTESNVEFLEKTELGLKNLVEIRKFINDTDFDKELQILSVYHKFSRFGFNYILAAVYFLFNPFILYLLKNNIGGLFLFDFYKLLLFSKKTN